MKFSKQFLMLEVEIEAGPLLTLPLIFSLYNLLGFYIQQYIFYLFPLTPKH